MKRVVEKQISIAKFIRAIRQLPSDKPNNNPDVWYRTQKEHWLGWLHEYNGPGAYGRTGGNHDAKFAYNHIVEPKMLLWLIEATKVNSNLLKAARLASTKGNTMMQKSGAIRKLVSWEEIHDAIWK